MANPQKENGHLDLANELVEALAKTYLSPNESQILWAVWRKTYCWHKKADWIAFSQFRELTGMIDPNISKILKRLVNRKILIRTNKLYSFNKDYDKWLSKQISGVIQTDKKKLSKQISGVIQTDKKKLSKQISTKEKPKETYTKEIIPKGIRTKSPDLDLQEVIDFSKSKNFSLQGSEKQNRQYAYNLIRKKFKGGVLGKDRVKWLIKVAISVRGQPYAPQVNDFKSLFYKWQDLLTFKQKGQNGKRGYEV